MSHRSIIALIVCVIPMQLFGMELSREQFLTEQHGISSADDPYLAEIVQRKLLPFDHYDQDEAVRYGCEVTSSTTHRAMCIFDRLCFNRNVLKAIDLIEKGYIRLDMKNPWGQTPLHIAASNANEALAQYLLRRAPQPEELLRQKNIWGDTPLEMAYIWERGRMQELLLSYSSLSLLRDLINKYNSPFFTETRSGPFKRLLQKNLEQKEAKLKTLFLCSFGVPDNNNPSAMRRLPREIQQRLLEFVIERPLKVSAKAKPNSSS